MKRIMGPLSLGMLMGAGVTSALMMMKPMKKSKKVSTPYMPKTESVKEN